MAQTLELNVTGMTCGHCVQAVTSALRSQPGVQAAEVSLEGKSATVTGDSLDTAGLIAAVAEEGYSASLK